MATSYPPNFVHGRRSDTVKYDDFSHFSVGDGGGFGWHATPSSLPDDCHGPRSDIVTKFPPLCVDDCHGL